VITILTKEMSLVELNLQHLLKEISPESPCGENFEEDAIFLKLENEARFVEERQMGATIEPAQEPDWKVVRSLALELLERTRDIQVAMHLTCSLLRIDGFNGLNQGLSLLNGWLEKYWDSVYPLQDPEDDYPMLRVNTLSSLNDYTLIRGAINHIPLIQSKLGGVSWRDIEIAEGKKTPSEGQAPLEMSVIEAAFNDADIETLQNLVQSVKQSLEQVQSITNVVVDKVDAVNAPDFSALTSLLQGIAKFAGDKLQQRQLIDAENDDAEMGEGAAGSSLNAVNSNKVIRQSGIHNRNDVVRAVDEICKYFDRYEPSSPIPFLLLRAKKLLTMNFMEILQDMTPDAVNQAENICGVQKDNKD